MRPGSRPEAELTTCPTLGCGYTLGGGRAERPAEPAPTRERPRRPTPRPGRHLPRPRPPRRWGAPPGTHADGLRTARTVGLGLVRLKFPESIARWVTEDYAEMRVERANNGDVVVNLTSQSVPWAVSKALLLRATLFGSDLATLLGSRSDLGAPHWLWFSSKSKTVALVPPE